MLKLHLQIFDSKGIMIIDKDIDTIEINVEEKKLCFQNEIGADIEKACIDIEGCQIIVI